MIFRFFLFLTGFGMSVAGGVSTIAYLNLLTTGMNFWNYISFIFTRVEFFLFPVGLVVIGLSIYLPSSDN